MRKIFRLDRTTHKYLIEPISRMRHLKMSLMKRTEKFINSLSNSRKRALRNVSQILVNDCRSTIGRNQRLIRLSETSRREVVNGLITQFEPIPIEETWRLSVINDMLEVRNDQSCIPFWNKDEIDSLLYHACTS